MEWHKQHAGESLKISKKAGQVNETKGTVPEGGPLFFI
jgi:hypothetical protein